MVRYTSNNDMTCPTQTSTVKSLNGQRPRGTGTNLITDLGHSWQLEVEATAQQC